MIRTLKRLDRETIPEYELTVVATDKGKPPLSSSVKVKITLDDVRDSKPKFEKDPYIVFIKEDIKERSDVVKVTAVSQDLVQGAPIAYSIISGNDPLTFVIQRNGMIQTKTKLDYEVRSEYILKVRATSSPYFVETIVNITLVDVNDNQPVLQNFFMVINVMDDKFPKQPKFRIPAYDPDVSDHLVFEIQSITQGDWVILNRTTGDLVLSSTLQNTRKPVSMVVRVSDGVYYSTANGQILVTTITTQMLNNSLALDVYDATIQGFFDSSYEELVRAISDVVNCGLDQIALFNIESKVIKAESPLDDDTSELKIWLAVYQVDSSRNRIGFYNPEYIRHLIYINLSQISERTKLTLLPFEDGLCVKEVCNFPKPTTRKLCASYAEYTGKSNTYSSRKVVFRTVGVQMSNRCPCAKNYQGDHCDTGLNLCYSNPCQENGKCVSVDGGYSCICNQGRIGKNCEIDISKSRCPSDVKTSEDHLELNPCSNGGVCKDSSGGGFTCECRSGSAVDRPFCELSTRSFKRGTFIAFPGKFVHSNLVTSYQKCWSAMIVFGRSNNVHGCTTMCMLMAVVSLTLNINQRLPFFPRIQSKMATAYQAGICHHRTQWLAPFQWSI